MSQPSKSFIIIDINLSKLDSEKSSNVKRLVLCVLIFYYMYVCISDYVGVYVYMYMNADNLSYQKMLESLSWSNRYLWATFCGVWELYLGHFQEQC